MEKEIAGYEGRYTVTDAGEIFSIFKNKKEKRNLVKGLRGYLQVALWANNAGKTLPVHRIVAQTFIENPLNKPCVNHIDGNKHNNNISNLEWVTYGENKHHSFAVLGEKHWMKDKQGKLCINHKIVEQVDMLTGNVVAKYFGTAEAHRLTGFSQGNIASVCRGERFQANGYFWRYINEHT